MKKIKIINKKNYIIGAIIIMLWIFGTLLWQAHEPILIAIAWLSLVLWLTISAIYFYESLDSKKMYLKIIFSIVNIFAYFWICTVILFIFNSLF